MTTSDASRLRPALAAKQERSKLTLERILTAAERLLDEKDFDALTMAELAKAAHCGVGTLYGRIPNKDSLLVCLHERYMDQALAFSAAVFEKCAGGSLEERVRGMCTMFVDFLATRRGVTRAVTSHLFSRSEEDVASFRNRASSGFRQAAAFLAEKVDPAVHPRREAACQFALLTLSDVAQGRLAFMDRSALRIRYSRRELKDRLTAQALAYLGGHPRSARKKRKEP